MSDEECDDAVDHESPCDSDGQVSDCDESVGGLSSAGSHWSRDFDNHSPTNDNSDQSESPTESEPITEDDRNFKKFIGDLCDQVEAIGNRLDTFVLKITRQLKAVTHRKRSRSPDTSSEGGNSSSDSDTDHAYFRARNRKRRRCSSRDGRRCCEQLVIRKDHKRKSGLQLGVEVNVRKRITCPHQFVLRNSLSVRFDLLTVAELVSGLLSMSDRAKAKRRRTESRSIKHLAQSVLEDAKFLDWPVVRRSVQAVLLKLERGSLKWSDTRKIKELRQWELVMPVKKAPAGQSSMRQGNSSAVPCIPFQSGTCNIGSTEHMSDTGEVKHICRYCLNTVSREFPHSEKSCRRKKIRSSPRDGQRPPDNKPTLK